MTNVLQMMSKWMTLSLFHSMIILYSQKGDKVQTPVIIFLNDQMKVENQKLTWTITCDNDGFSQLTLTWRTPGVNMSVTHSAYQKKTLSERRRNSQRKHDYVQSRNIKHRKNIGTMTDNIDD